MTIVVCDQFAVLGDTCPGCGGWLHRVQQGGFPGLHGARFCDEDCIAEDQESQRHATLRREDDELPEWVRQDMARMRAQRGTDEPWEPAEFDRMARERGWP